ncbi:uncharacterized protein B0P05DRAFT_571892 [Gilbertella persicaria]|uniref:uncharacterized protein n=1 Tax=Gilbertella persicaria TaxID=101096 RepID=UPI00221F110A|nr:uncharacterized protein B0P05DRAFT_571892 [Gilbertella persicaria]KAI8078235.1 hypothetical protein B0P05DRAFT_571892 [Gilbertella persicaria]
MSSQTNGENQYHKEPEEDIVEDFARQLDTLVHIQEDSDNDSIFHEYQPIPQDEAYQPLTSDNEEEQEEQGPLMIKLDDSNKLNSETSDLIKSIMSHIQLSNEAIPDWAKKIPEEAWLPRVKKE